MNVRLQPNAGGGRIATPSRQPNAGGGYNRPTPTRPVVASGPTTSTNGLAGFLGINFANPNEAAAYGGNRGLLALTRIGQTVTGVQQVAAQVKFGGGQIARSFNGGDYTEVNLDGVSARGGRSGLQTALLIGAGLLGTIVVYKLVKS